MTLRIPGRHEKDLSKFQTAIEQIGQGRLNCTGVTTLSVGTSTTVAAPTVAPGTIIIWMPQTASAAAAMTNVFVAAANVSAEQFIFTHAAGPADRTFGWIAIG